MKTLHQQYEQDRDIWNGCAETYERRIVRGHPDVTAYESFEHSFIDRLVLHCTRDRGLRLHCYDFGCGSGRIHTLLAPQLLLSSAAGGTPQRDDHRSGGVMHVGGIDFSEQMIRIAEQNLVEAHLQELHPRYLSFDIGSAFDVPAYRGENTPLAVSVCNSIGVMQGLEGAENLFKVMYRYVSGRRGMAVISCYRKEAVAEYALGNYESTMDVCGQPCWLEPDTYASPAYTLLPEYYKRAYDDDPSITVDVVDRNQKHAGTKVTLTRDTQKVREVIATGSIDTCTGYHSHWYGTGLVKEWMRKFWSDGELWHIEGKQLDCLRGEPAQLAVVDFSGSFASLAAKWNLSPLEQQ